MSRSAAQIALAVLALSFPVAVRAQQAVADSLWRTGNRTDAIAAYRRVIASDSLAVRANFRIAEDLADRNIDSALLYVRTARVRVPTDPELQFAEATYLSWAGRYDAAVARFDSMIVANPAADYVRVARARVFSWKGDFVAAERGYAEVVQRSGAQATDRADAQFGLAQVAAWQGSLDVAVDRYSEILAAHPDDVRSLVGLAAVRSWQARPNAANELLQRAITQDSGNRDAKQLLAGVTRSRAPSLEINASWSHDSDDNNVAWQTATQSFLLRDGLKVWGSAGSQSARDPLRQTTRLLGEAGGTITGNIFRATATLGARQLDVSQAPTGVSSETEITWRISGGARLRPNLSVGLGASHVPFDEIAALLARGITLTSYDGSAEWNPFAGVAVGVGAGMLDFSDGNRRTSASLRVSRRLRKDLTVGAMARTFSFRFDGDGYFTPERFMLGDLFGSFEREISKWNLGVTAGGGLQKLGPDEASTAQWHVDARAMFRVTERTSIGVFGGTSTAAFASAVGAFRYQAFGVSGRLVF